MKKNVKEGGLAVPDLKLYYLAVVLKTIWYWLRDRKEHQWNSLEESDLTKQSMINPRSPASGTIGQYLTKTAGKTGKQYGRDWV